MKTLQKSQRCCFLWDSFVFSGLERVEQKKVSLAVVENVDSEFKVFFSTLLLLPVIKSTGLELAYKMIFLQCNRMEGLGPTSLVSHAKQREKKCEIMHIVTEQPSFWINTKSDSICKHKSKTTDWFNYEHLHLNTLIEFFFISKWLSKILFILPFAHTRLLMEEIASTSLLC